MSGLQESGRNRPAETVIAQTGFVKRT